MTDPYGFKPEFSLHYQNNSQHFANTEYTSNFPQPYIGTAMQVPPLGSFNYGLPVYPLNCGYIWVRTDNRSSLPSSALEAGIDSDGCRIYVGRAMHEGDWIPAKVIPEKNISYVAYGGEEHAKEQYEVLCEQRFHWQHTSGSDIPFGAVEGGRTSEGETLYIGRASHAGSITVGKVQPSHGTCYIPYGGEEHAHSEYEILVLTD